MNEKLCTGCSLCTTKCPTKNISNEFEQGLSTRTAIYVPFPQAVPNKPVIDRANCRYFLTGKCKVCQKLCPTGAIDFEQKDEIIDVKAGAIVLASVLPERTTMSLLAGLSKKTGQNIFADGSQLFMKKTGN